MLCSHGVICDVRTYSRYVYVYKTTVQGLSTFVLVTAKSNSRIINFFQPAAVRLLEQRRKYKQYQILSTVTTVLNRKHCCSVVATVVRRTHKCCAIPTLPGLFICLCVFCRSCLFVWISSAAKLINQLEYLTSVGPCVVIYCYSKTNQVHKFHQLFYFGMTLHMFRTVFPSIIRSSRLYIYLLLYVQS